MDVSEGGRTVLFTATAGSLRVGDRTRADSLSVETDLRGEAAIDLVSPPESAVAQVTATIEGITPALTQQRNIRFTPITAEDILSFEELPDTVEVGASSKTEIRVRIDPGLEGEDRRVQFSTCLGRFLFGAGEGGETRAVLADEEGVATVILVSPDEGGEAVVTATVRDFSLEETIRFIAEPSITFLEAPTSAPADGFTLTQFSVVISSEWDGDESRSVEFVTTAGTLVSGDEEGRRVFLVAGERDTTEIFLRSPHQVGVAVVTASLKGREDETSIDFDLAPPDSIVVIIDSDKFRLRPHEQTNVQAFLIREGGRGRVSEGLNVSFSAADSMGSGIPLARFFNVTPADSSGIAAAIFTPDGSDFRGLVTITATYFDAEKTVAGTANVRIVDE